MAFYRSNVRVPLLVNHVYCKFYTSEFKLHLLRRQLTSTNKILTQKRARHVTSYGKENIKSATLCQCIQSRKAEARRSIVVQVASWRSCKDLLTYCSQFGLIKNVFYYILPKDHHFVLLEYKHYSSAMNATKAATYMDKENIIPSRTNVMWYRKIEESEQTSENRTRNLPSINNINYIVSNESIIREALGRAQTMSSQMITLHNEYKISELEIRLKFQIITTLEQYFSGIFPNVEVQPFGSFINGFGKKLCDLDLVLFADGLKKENFKSKLVFHTKPANINEKQQTHEFMGVLADTMKYMIPGISNVRKIFNARVPIIKFHNVFTHTECDLSKSNIIATYMTEVLYLYGLIDNRVRPLVFTIRKWAQDNKLTSVHPGKTITNFSLTLLIIFYLQQKKILPTINQMEGFEGIKVSSDNFLDKIYFHSIKKNWIINNNYDCLDNLLTNFFKYYSTFNFNENEICLRKGCTFKKLNSQPLYIHNPFEPGLNVSKNVSQNEISRMKTLMTIAISNLENTSSLRSKNWGILSIFNIPVSPNSNTSTDVLQTFDKEDEITSKEEVKSENSETIENIEKSNIDTTLNTETREEKTEKVILKQIRK